MIEMSDPAFVFVDIETTGLEPTTDALLEVGIVITDRNLKTLHAQAWVLSSRLAPDAADWAPAANEMHARNGLIDACHKSDLTITEMENQALAWLTKHGIKRGKFPMVGSSIHFDRKFLSWHSPGLEQHFHYRNIDCSSLKELVRVWLPDQMHKSSPNKAHRTLADINASIVELQYYRELLFGVESYRDVTSPF